MCGIAGIFLKNHTERLGTTLVEMLKLIRHRGMDSSGLALYGPCQPGRYYCRVSLQKPEDLALAKSIIDGKVVVDDGFCETTNSSYLMYNAVLSGDQAQIDQIYHEIDSHWNLCVHSLGSCLVVAKDLGDAENLAGVRFVADFNAFHGIGHVRLATESIDNLNFAHPFTSETFPSLSIVHNGQLTNYFNLRRRLERAGVSFKTRNDSELIAHYLAYQLSVRGKTLRESLEQAIEELDGVYSCLVATGSEIGAFQDRLGLKPILVCELPDMVLFGSERICFTPVSVEAGESWEIKPGEARTWSH